jgi:hypothetical protein
VPFGKYKGKTLEQIATTDSDGPRYLDWLVGLKDLSPDVKTALKTFLAISWVSELVDRAVEDHTPRVSSEPVENLKQPRPWWEKK